MIPAVQAPVYEVDWNHVETVRVVPCGTAKMGQGKPMLFRAAPVTHWPHGTPVVSGPTETVVSARPAKLASGWVAPNGLGMEITRADAETSSGLLSAAAAGETTGDGHKAGSHQ